METVNFRRRHGFTLVELLITISVIGILLAILLPAVQAAREAARRMRCQSNLRQIGLTLHNFDSAHGELPSGTTAAEGQVGGVCEPEEVEVEDNPGKCTEYHSWTALCLPFFENASLASAYDFDRPWSSLNNRPVVTKTLGIFQCPSSVSHLRADTHFVRGAAATDYGAIHLVERRVFTDVFGVADPGIDARQGVLAKHVGNPTKRIIDGLSKTLMVSECAGRPESYVGGAPMTASQFANYNDDGIVDLDGRFVADDGIGWADPDSGFDVKGLSENGVEVYGPRMINGINVGQAHSFHGRGAHFLFADGSVRFIDDDIDPWIYVTLCTRAGKELVEGFY